MKVLLLVHGLPVGGTEMLVFHLAQSLRRSKGVGVEVGCLDTVGSLGDELLREGIPVVCYSRKPGLDVRLPWRIATHVDRSSIDLIHAHQTTCYVYGVLAKLLCGARLVFTEHGRFHPDTSTLRRRAFNKLFSRFVDHTTAVSASVRRSLLVIEGFRRREIEIIPNAIDVGRFLSAATTRLEARCALGISGDAVVVGSVGRLDPIKNQALLIRAVALLEREVPGLLLVIVGEGPERHRLESTARDLRVSDRVLLLGARQDVTKILPAFDVFALSSRSEGVPLTLLEAMAASVPIISTAVGGIPEILNDGTEACLVSLPNGGPGSMPQDLVFSGALKRLLFDPDLRSRLSVNALLRVQRDFSLGLLLRRYYAVYERLLSKGLSC